MGQKTNPIGNRLGYIKGWDSNWFGGNKYGDKLVEDNKIRKFTLAELKRTANGRDDRGSFRRDPQVAKIVIERTLKLITVTIHTAKPGLVIGKGGQDVELLRLKLKKLTGKEVQINIFEVKRPEMDANLVAQSIAGQIQGRISFRRAIKGTIASTMRVGAEGIKVTIAGRLNGAEMARTEQFKDGRIPLHTFRADIDYALAEAHTSYGRLGIKVWICKGMVYGKRDLSPISGAQKGSGKGGGRQGGGRGGQRQRRK